MSPMELPLMHGGDNANAPAVPAWITRLLGEGLKTLMNRCLGVLMFATSLYVAAESPPYQGEQARTIKSFSESDIEALLEGRGWGFAKAAELNGFPGPLHVLENDEALGLDERQRAAVQVIFERMRARAIALGERFLAAESALDRAFASGTINSRTLNVLVADAESLSGELRAVHLAAHLEVTPLLSDRQRHRYAVLRGYATGATHKHSGSAGKH